MIPERTSRRAIAVASGGFETKEQAVKQCDCYYDALPVEIIFEDGKPVDVKLHKDEK